MTPGPTAPDVDDIEEVEDDGAFRYVRAESGVDFEGCRHAFYIVRPDHSASVYMFDLNGPIYTEIRRYRSEEPGVSMNDATRFLRLLVDNGYSDTGLPVYVH